MSARPALKTLHVINGLSMGGAEQMLYKVITHSKFPASQHVVISLTDEGVFAPKLRSLGCFVVALNMRKQFFSSLTTFCRFVYLLYQIKPQRVMCWMYHACFFGTLAKLFYWRRSPIFWNIRHAANDLKQQKRTTAFLIKYLKWLSFIPQKITYPSSKSIQCHVQKLGYPASKTVQISVGFDVAHFCPSPELRMTLRHKLGVANTDFLIGHAARFHPVKDHENLLRAFQILRAKMPNIYLALCGRFIDRDNKVLMEKIQQLGLSKHVFLLGEKSDLRDFYPALDLFVLNSRSEGFSNVVGEAMACQVPCVVTNIGDLDKLIARSECIVPPADPAALAKACIELLNQPKKVREQLGALGRETIAQHYTIQKIAEQFDNL